MAVLINLGRGNYTPPAHAGIDPGFVAGHGAGIPPSLRSGYHPNFDPGFPGFAGHGAGVAPKLPVKYYTYKRQVKLGNGQALHFQKGKGYYAGPGQPSLPVVGTPPHAVTNPPPPRTVNPSTGQTTVAPPVQPPNPWSADTPAQLQAQAASEAQAQLTPQEQMIQQEQAQAQQEAVALEQGQAGFGEAAAGLLGKMAPEVSAGYSQAAQDIGAIGAGVGQGVESALSQGDQAAMQFAASQGQNVGTGSSINPGQEGQTIGTLGGTLPGNDLAQQGAANTAFAAAQPEVMLASTRDALKGLMASAVTQNDQYAQQLIQLAQQYPQYYTQAMQQLQQYELDKANYREQVKVDNSNIAAQKAQTAQQNAALKANIAAAKGSTAVAKGTLAYKWANLQFQTAKAKAAAQAAVRKGRTIDDTMSKLLGHVVYKDGTQDPTIKVHTAPTSDSAARAKASILVRENTAAHAAAVKLLGAPVLNKAGGKGKYILAPGLKPTPGTPSTWQDPVTRKWTTNNPARAEHAGNATSWQDAFNQVYQMVHDNLAQYGYTDSQIRSFVASQLEGAGWKRGK